MICPECLEIAQAEGAFDWYNDQFVLIGIRYRCPSCHIVLAEYKTDARKSVEWGVDYDPDRLIHQLVA